MWTKEKQKEYYKKWCSKNRKRINAYSRKYYNKNRYKIRKRRKGLPEKRNWIKRRIYQKNYMLKRNFGITLLEYEEIKNSQNGLCAICRVGQTYKNFAVDHDHKTNKIRGLLCKECNIGLGMFKDDIKLLEQAILYLKK